MCRQTANEKTPDSDATEKRKPGFALAEAIATYRWCIDTCHKLWGYFHAILAASVLFAWAGNGPRPDVALGVLSLLMGAFSVANCRILLDFQRAAVAASVAIKDAFNEMGLVEPRYSGLIGAFNPEPVRRVAVGHTAMWLSVLILVWIPSQAVQNACARSPWARHCKSPAKEAQAISSTSTPTSPVWGGHSG